MNQVVFLVPFWVKTAINVEVNDTTRALLPRTFTFLRFYIYCTTFQRKIKNIPTSFEGKIQNKSATSRGMNGRTMERKAKTGWTQTAIYSRSFEAFSLRYLLSLVRKCIYPSAPSVGPLFTKMWSKI